MSELFRTGLEVTVIGMGVVFVLLTMLVGIVTAMSRISSLIVGETPQLAEAMPTRSETTNTERDEIISVIGSAIRSYRRARNRRR